MFDKDKREIQVEGEVFIEVEKMKDKPFIVKAGDMTIQVYGTVFNVSTYANDGENYVVLVEGSVKVSTTHENIILEPNKRAIIKGDHISTHDTDVNDFISWKNGYLILKQESLSGVLKKWNAITIYRSATNRSSISTTNVYRENCIYQVT